MALPTCQKCGKPIPRGKETAAGGAKIVHMAPGQMAVLMFRHAHEADCRRAGR